MKLILMGWFNVGRGAGNTTGRGSYDKNVVIRKKHKWILNRCCRDNSIIKLKGPSVHRSFHMSISPSVTMSSNTSSNITTISLAK